MKKLFVITLLLICGVALAQESNPTPTPTPRRGHVKARMKPTPMPTSSPTPMNETEKRAQAASNVLNTILLWFAMIVGYWLPSLVAFHRKHKNRMAITVANLLWGGQSSGGL